jgi:hypothetical protein
MNLPNANGITFGSNTTYRIVDPFAGAVVTHSGPFDPRVTPADVGRTVDEIVRKTRPGRNTMPKTAASSTNGLTLTPGANRAPTSLPNAEALIATGVVQSVDGWVPSVWVGGAIVWQGDAVPLDTSSDEDDDAAVSKAVQAANARLVDVFRSLFAAPATNGPVGFTSSGPSA